VNVDRKNRVSSSEPRRPAASRHARRHRRHAENAHRPRFAGGQNFRATYSSFPLSSPASHRSFPSCSRDRRINRYYDPGTGQFLSVDPDVGSTGTPYAYAGDDPANNTDANGLASSSHIEKFKSPAIYLVFGLLWVKLQFSVTVKGPHNCDAQVDWTGDIGFDCGGTIAWSWSSGNAIQYGLQYAGAMVSADLWGNFHYSYTATGKVGKDQVNYTMEVTIGNRLDDSAPPGFRLTPREARAMGYSVVAVGAGAGGWAFWTVFGKALTTLGCQVLGGGPEDPASDLCTGAAWAA
jgi:hypothetical protein